MNKPVSAAPQPAPAAGDGEKAPADTPSTLEARKEMQAAVKEDLAAGSDGTNRDAADGRPEPAPTLETRPSTVTDQTSTAAVSPRPSNPQVYGAGHRDSRIVVVAREDSWVQVKGTGNDLLLTRMLKAGDSYRVPNRRDLTLTTGNAGAIEIFVDGRPLGRLGPQGAVRRDVSLIAEDLLGRFGASVERKADETNSQ